jgi:hypothetical protein
MKYIHLKEQQSFAYIEDYEELHCKKRSCQTTIINLSNVKCEVTGCFVTIVSLHFHVQQRTLFPEMENYQILLIFNFSYNFEKKNK